MGQLHRHDDRLVTAKRVYLRPAVRGQGLGRTLAERLLDEAASDGFERLHLTVSPYHRRARGLYDSLGFEPVSPPAWTTVSPERHDEWLFLERSLADRR